MQIIWSSYSKKCLRNIYSYYKNVAGESVAKKISNQIFDATKYLNQYPESGSIEPLLVDCDQEYRYCIAGNYKIIYTIIDGRLLISDVFDTRQNPVKINKPNR